MSALIQLETGLGFPRQCPPVTLKYYSTFPLKAWRVLPHLSGTGWANSSTQALARPTPAPSGSDFLNR